SAPRAEFSQYQLVEHVNRLSGCWKWVATVERWKPSANQPQPRSCQSPLSNTPPTTGWAEVKPSRSKGVVMAPGSPETVGALAAAANAPRSTARWRSCLATYSVVAP